MSSKVKNETAVISTLPPLINTSAAGEQSLMGDGIWSRAACVRGSLPEGLPGTLDEWETGVNNMSSLLEGLGISLFVWTIKQWDLASVAVIKLQNEGVPGIVLWGRMKGKKEKRNSDDDSIK